MGNLYNLERGREVQESEKWVWKKKKKGKMKVKWWERCGCLCKTSSLLYCL